MSMSRFSDLVRRDLIIIPERMSKYHPHVISGVSTFSEWPQLKIKEQTSRLEFSKSAVVDCVCNASSTYFYPVSFVCSSMVHSIVCWVPLLIGL